MILDVIMITVIVSFVVDISGFVESVKYGLFRVIKGKDVEYREYSFKPFDCSLCMSFWTVFLYGIFVNVRLLDSVFVACIAAFSASVISQLMTFIKGSIVAGIDYITKKIDV